MSLMPALKKQREAGVALKVREQPGLQIKSRTARALTQRNPVSEKPEPISFLWLDAASWGTTLSFMHLSTDGHLSCFLTSAGVDGATVNMEVWGFLGVLILILSAVSPTVAVLNHVAVLFKFWKNPCTALIVEAVQFILTSTV